MDYWNLCLSKEGMSVCLTGVLIGIVLTLIMVWVWFAWGASENFMGSDMSPEAKKLLVMHWAADPGSGKMDREIYGKQ